MNLLIFCITSAERKAWVFDGGEVNEVTHWMPIEPPKEVSP